MDKSQNYADLRNQTQEISNWRISWHEVPEQTKVICGEKNQVATFVAGMDWESPTFWGGENVLYLNLGGGCIGV